MTEPQTPPFQVTAESYIAVLRDRLVERDARIKALDDQLILLLAQNRDLQAQIRGLLAAQSDESAVAGMSDSSD
jgi:hypothetical protein